MSENTASNTSKQIIAVALLGLLVITNPSMESYELFVQQQIIHESGKSGGLGAALGLLFGGITSNVLLNATVRTNYVIFSTYRLSLGASHTTTLGILGNFFNLPNPSDTLANEKAATEAKVQAIEAKEQASDRNKISALANALALDIDFIQNTKIPADFSTIEQAIGDQLSVLQNMKKDLDGLKHDAAVTPMTCYQAYQVVGYDFSQTLTYDFNQTLGYFVGNYRNAKGDLEKRLANEKLISEKINFDSSALRQALQSSKFHFQPKNVTPELAIEQLAKYQAIASTAETRLPELKTKVDNIVEQAKQIMAEGKSVTQGTQSQVHCR